MKLTKQSDAELAKTRNIIDMAIDFNGMMRIFGKESKRNIASKLETHFSSLVKINTREDYEKSHWVFCEWFTREIPQRKRS